LKLLQMPDCKTVLGILVSIVFLLVFVKKINLEQLLDAMYALDWRYLVPALFSTFVSYLLRAVRWRYLLIHEKRISIRSLYSSTIIGYMANNLFPARLGEFIRAWMLSKREQISGPKVFASLVIDRLCDGCTVMLLLVIALFTLRLPTGMESYAELLKIGGAITLVFYLAVLGLLVLFKIRTFWMIGLMGRLFRPFPAVLSEKLIPFFGNFVEGIRLSAKSSDRLMIALSSILIWFFAVWPIDLVLKGFGIHLPYSASIFIMVLLVFAVMIPSAPGFIGTYHMACFTGLSAFKVAEGRAISIALIIHALAFFPVILAGFYHLWADGTSLSKIKANLPDGEKN
jgi:glycosyltransferase 2 family protein